MLDSELNWFTLMLGTKLKLEVAFFWRVSLPPPAPLKKHYIYKYFFSSVNCCVEDVLCMVSIQKVCYDWNAAAAWSCGDGGRCREMASPPAYRGSSPHLYLEHKTALFVSDKSYYIYKCMYLLRSCLILSLCECVCGKQDTNRKCQTLVTGCDVHINVASV